MKAFMEIGRDRNRLVHEDFATFTLEKTAEEIHNHYQTALVFVNCIAAEFRNCSDAIRFEEKAGEDNAPEPNVIQR